MCDSKRDEFRSPIRRHGFAVSIYALLFCFSSAANGQQTFTKVKTTQYFLFDLKYEKTIAGDTIGGAGIQQPRGMAHLADGSMYVVDSGANRVLHLGANGNIIRQWGRPGSGNGEFDKPSAVVVAADGSVLVSDTANCRIQRFSPTGAFISAFGERGTGPGKLSCPMGLALGTDGAIFIADAVDHEVECFSPDGSYLKSWGKIGTGSGELFFPTFISVSRCGEIAVTEALSNNPRVQIFSTGGAFIRQITREETGITNFQPRGISFAPNGVFYLAEQSSGAILAFDADNRPVSCAQSTTGDRLFDVADYLATGDNGLLTLSDTSAGEIQHYRFQAVVIGGKKVDVNGRIDGISAADLDSVQLTIRGSYRKKPIWATTHVAADGVFSFSGFPKSAAFRLDISFDRSRYQIRRTTVTGVGSDSAEPIVFKFKRRK